MRLQPDTSVRWLVVNTRLAAPDFDAISWRADGANGTTCGSLFLVREPGMLQVAPSALSSSRVMPATSRSRAPVNSKTLSSLPNGSPTLPQASQNRRNSSVQHALTRVRRRRAMQAPAEVLRNLSVLQQPTEERAQRREQSAWTRIAGSIIARVDARHGDSARLVYHAPNFVRIDLAHVFLGPALRKPAFNHLRPSLCWVAAGQVGEAQQACCLAPSPWARPPTS